MSPYTPGLPATTIPREDWADWLTRSQRVTTYRWTLHDAATDRRIGALQPAAGAQLQHTTGQAIPRRLTLTLPPDQAAGFDVVTSRVRVAAVMGDGSVYPLGGRYMAVDDTTIPTGARSSLPLALVDETHIPSQALDRGFTARLASSSALQLGQPAGMMARRFLDRFAFFNSGPYDGPQAPGVQQPYGYRIPVEIEPSTYLSDGSWSAGAAGSQVLADLAVAGDFFSPWIDNHGVFRMIRSFDPGRRVPAFDWDTTPAVIDGSAAITTDLLRAPNRYVVVSNGGSGPTSRPIVGSYDVPSAAPWSAARRGYVVPEVVTMQVGTVEQATAIARNLAQRRQVYERAEVSTPPDPRHDAYDVIRWRGALWLELGWSLTLTPGAPMRHTLRRAYA